MNTTTISPRSTPAHGQQGNPTSRVRRIFDVVARPQTYRNIGYLLLGLPLGTAWFTVLISGFTTAVSLLVVALLGVPMLVGMWYATRAFANLERATTSALLGGRLPLAPMASTARGNPWVQLRAMSRDRDRWRELAYLLLRFPVGIATFTAAVTAVATPLLVAYAPFNVRYVDEHPFGDGALSSRMEDVASSPWAWLLVPLGLAMLVASLHLLNALARACGRWTRAWLGAEAAADISEASDRS